VGTHSIDRKGGCLVGLRVVHGGPSGGIDDDLMLTNGSTNSLKVSDVKIGRAESGDVFAMLDQHLAEIGTKHSAGTRH
jgi:hypothetical protein